MNRQLLFKTLAAIVACLALALPAGAYNFEKDGIYYNVSGSNATVTYKDANYNSYSGTVSIPATVTNGGTNYTVRSIGPSAFEGCQDLRRVVIPNTVQYISNYAFRNCTSLTNITIPASVYTIYNNVFEGCTALRSVICLNPNPRDWYANNFSNSTYTYGALFVPQGSVEAYQSSTGTCWENFPRVEAITCDFVQDAIFYKDLGNNQVAVSNVADCEKCYSGEIVIPQTVTNNGTTYTVTAVGFGTFYYGHNLTSVVFPSTVNELGAYAFYDCPQLTSVNIPDGVPRLNYCVFNGCTSLPSITIPASVTYIDQHAFGYCNALSTITCLGTTPPECATTNCFQSSIYTNATLRVPGSALSAYQEANVWKEFSNIEGVYYDFEENGIYYLITGPNTASVTYKDRNFNSYSGTVNVPATVTHEGQTYTVTAVGRLAFYNCTGLTSVTLPNTVTLLDYAAFYNCTSLTSVNIPSSVTTLGEFCFESCESLASVTIPSGVTAIPRQCFLLCKALTSITIPGTVKEISYFAFYGCENLRYVTLQNGVESILQSAFESCWALETISIPASVTTIGEGVLSGCNALASINVDSSNTHYCSHDGVLFTASMDSLLAFPNMSATSYVIPPGVQVIGMDAFFYCDNLQSVTLPEGLMTIGVNAFGYCDKITEIDIPSSVAEIGDNAFSNCILLASINVADGNQTFMSDYGVLYTRDGKELLQYPSARPDKHYSILNTTKELVGQAFAGSQYLKSVYLPEGLRYIPQQCFRGSNLERVVIDEGVDTIGMYAFAYCSNLKSVYLPSTLKQIERLAFQSDTGIEQITFAGSTPPAVGNNAFYGVGYEVDEPLVYVPGNAVSNYESLNWQSSYFNPDVNPISAIASGNDFIVDSLKFTVIDDNLKVMVSDITSNNLVDPGIPPKVSYLGNLCTVTKLKDHSFDQIHKMVRAEVPFTVELIDSYCFYNCSALEKLILREGVKTIGGYAFSHINALPDVTIPASVDSVSGNAFTYDRSLSAINVNSANTKYTSVDGILFSKDKKRLVAYADGHGDEYIVPDGTQVIGRESFRGAEALTAVVLPGTLRQIEGTSFFDCTSLEEMEVPHGVTFIGNSAFGGCTAMTSADLPATLTSLGYNAFYNVPDLTHLNVRATTPPTCVTQMDSHTHELYEPFINDHYTNVQLVVPLNCAVAYREASVWKKFTNIIETNFPVIFIRGDVNGDGLVNITDVVRLISYLLNNNGDGMDMNGADANQDGIINISDVTVLINYVATGRWPDAGIDMWYLIGDRVGTAPWENNGKSSIGRGLIPLFPQNEFDDQGKGVLVYTGWFGADEGFKVIHHPGSEDDCWGTNAGGIFTHGDGSQLQPFYTGNDGFYTIMLYTQLGRIYIFPYNATTPTAFNCISMPGGHCYWVVDDADYFMDRLNPDKENHNWIYRNFTLTADNELKFAANGNWDINWGDTPFPFGIGAQNGLNIQAKAGTYDVYFNDITGHYNFIKK
jgi:hypothetical protein